MNEIHEECPDFSTPSFLTEMWERMVYQYNACVAEGIHFLLSKYEEGISFGEIKRYSMAPDGKGGTAWKYTPIFLFDREDGFWRSVALPGIQQERQRQDIQTLVAARKRPFKTTPVDRKKKDIGRTGGVGEEARRAYPTGSTLTLMGRKLGSNHRPLDKDGKALRYGFSSHAGCPIGHKCNFSQEKTNGCGWHPMGYSVRTCATGWNYLKKAH